MVELTRKQREIERRTLEILKVSRPILIREGFQALSMDRVASQMEYAKGTIYNHFPNKEEIVVALAIQSMELRKALFHCAAFDEISVNQSHRVRMMALGAACEFFTTECTEDFLVEQWIRNNNIWDKTSESRQDLIRQCEAQCMQVASTILTDAIQAGDLVLPKHLAAQECVFGFWALVFGSQILTYSSPSLQAVGIANPFQAIRVHCCTLLNGFGWEPVISWEDYEECMTDLIQAFKPKFTAILEERQKKLS